MTMRRYAVTLFWAVFAACVALWTVGGVTSGLPVIALVAATYVVARHRPGRPLLLAIGAIALMIGDAVLSKDLGWRDLFTLVILFAAAALLGLYRVAVKEKAEREVKLAAAAERARIAREVHDIVSHSVSVMIALADGASLSAASQPERSAEVMAKVSGTGRHALAELQRLVSDLRQAPEDLSQLLDRLRATGLDVHLDVHGTAPDLSGDERLAIHRIVQESLTNSLRHAGPGTRAVVRLEYGRGWIDIQVTDDGSGHGLAGLRQRAQALGGTVQAGPGDSGGWQVRTRLTLGREHQ